MTTLEHPVCLAIDGCSCAKCQRLCRENPGWFSPEEAEAAMDAGLAHRLMLDWWVAEAGLNDTNVLAPASVGSEGARAPEAESLLDYFSGWCKGRCTFLNEEGRCALHITDFKPLQCRVNFGCKSSADDADNLSIARLWATDAGRSAVQRWKSLVGCADDPSHE